MTVTPLRSFVDDGVVLIVDSPDATVYHAADERSDSCPAIGSVVSEGSRILMIGVDAVPKLPPCELCFGD